MEDINPLDHEGLIHETLKQVRYAYGPGKLADYEDCVQTGYVALLEAAKTYDSSLGAFSSYAISRIRWAILREHRRSWDAIKKPPEVHRAYIECLKVAKKLEDENIHGAKAASIAREVGMTLKEYTTLLSYFEPVRRLDTPAPNNEDATLKDSLRDGYDHLEDVELNIYRLELRKDLERLMDSELTLEEREITKEYYGWDLPPMTMVRIAKERGTTPDRVRRVLATGLKKMRRFKGRLVLRHPEMTHHQQLRVRDERYRGIVRQLFEFYANSGDPVDWSGHFAVLEEVTPAYFTLLIAGNRYYVPIRSLVDVQIKDEKIQRIWLDVIYRD